GTVRLLLSQEVGDSSTVTVSSGGAFDLNGSGEIVSGLTVNGGSVTAGTGEIQAGTVTMTGGSITSTFGGDIVLGNVTTNISATPATISGTLNLNNISTHTFTIANGTAVPDLDISAVISNGGLTKDGPGSLQFSGSASNSYTGLTTVSDGRLDLAKIAGITA